MLTCLVSAALLCRLAWAAQRPRLVWAVLLTCLVSAVRCPRLVWVPLLPELAHRSGEGPLSICLPVQHCRPSPSRCCTRSTRYRCRGALAPRGDTSTQQKGAAVHP